MSDNPIPPGYYWASPEGSEDREVVRVDADQAGKPCVYVIGRDDDRPLAWYTNYVPVLSEAEVAELQDAVEPTPELPRRRAFKD